MSNTDFRKLTEDELSEVQSDAQPESNDWHRALAETQRRQAEKALSIAYEATTTTREANSISLKAQTYAQRANRIAIFAMILSVATAIGIAIIQWYPTP